MFKVIRRILAAVAVTLLALKAVSTILSLVENQEDSVADTWGDEDEVEDA